MIKTASLAAVKLEMIVLSRVVIEGDGVLCQLSIENFQIQVFELDVLS